jgi:Flp pilus assembly protein TadG
VSGDLQSFLRDERGSVILEMTVTVTVFFLVLFGIVEFSYLFYQWNTATKAVQFGARLAAVSDPVAEELTTLTGMEGGALPGEDMAPFDYTCTAAQNNCDVDGGDGGVRDIDALNTLVYGRGNGTTCVGTGANIGMCNIFDRITPANVKVRYQYTGLGYAGRPGGAVPTITVSLTGLTFNFVMLNGLVAGLPSSVSIPGLNTTITGEDLRAAGG